MITEALKDRFLGQRDRLLAEAHARPSTPAKAPLLVARIATVSGEEGAEADRNHMAALCRNLGAAAPDPNARWFILDAVAWRLRWERHTEFSTWTVMRPTTEGVAMFSRTALDLTPQDWLADLPGQILVAAHVEVVQALPAPTVFADEDLIASDVAGGAFQAFTDFRPGPDGFTRFVVVQKHGGPALAGRVLQQLLEIETYRLLALMAFPLATASAGPIARLESETADAVAQVEGEGGVDGDRRLLARLAALAGRAETLVGSVSFRFSAARAYHGLVQERIGELNERAIGEFPTIGEFMHRRLAPAMRTCVATAERQRDVIARIARTTQMLSTRVEVAAEAINLELLESMDRRAQLQLRVEETVEGLSVAAISYYALALLKVILEGVAQLRHDLDATIASALAAPLVVFMVWRFIRRIRSEIIGEPAGGARHGSDNRSSWPAP
jgi:uncharacterized membrane-anchored protein